MSKFTDVVKKVTTNKGILNVVKVILITGATAIGITFTPEMAEVFCSAK